MKNKIYIAIICAFSIVFAVSSGFLIKHYCDSAKQAEMYDNLIEVVETEPEETTELMNYSEEKTFIPEYQELYLQNNDMVGWIKVEDTKINYPVMQSKDNPNFYLKHGILIRLHRLRLSLCSENCRYGTAKRQYHYLRSSYERRLYVRRSYEIQGQELLGKAQNSIL